MATIDEKLDAIAAQLAILVKALTVTGTTADGGTAPRADTPLAGGSPTGGTPASSALPPGVPHNPMLDAYADSNPVGLDGVGAGSSPAGGNGTSFADQTFDFRDGALRRYEGSGTRTTTATHPAKVSFSIGESGGNGARTWRIALQVNGVTVYDKAASAYQVVPDTPVPVREGDLIALSIIGDGAVISARMGVSQ